MCFLICVDFLFHLQLPLSESSPFSSMSSLTANGETSVQGSQIEEIKTLLQTLIHSMGKSDDKANVKRVAKLIESEKRADTPPFDVLGFRAYLISTEFSDLMLVKARYTQAHHILELRLHIFYLRR